MRIERLPRTRAVTRPAIPGSPVSSRGTCTTPVARRAATRPSRELAQRANARFTPRCPPWRNTLLLMSDVEQKRPDVDVPPCAGGLPFELAEQFAAQGRPRPEHRKRRGSSAVPAHGNRYGEQRSWCPYMGPTASAGRSRDDMSTPQKRLSTRHYLLTTSDNRRSGRSRRRNAINPLTHIIGFSA
jgi:hypothetical protein